MSIQASVPPTNWTGWQRWLEQEPGALDQARPLQDWALRGQFDHLRRLDLVAISAFPPIIARLDPIHRYDARWRSSLHRLRECKLDHLRPAVSVVATGGQRFRWKVKVISALAAPSPT
ncbi:MAG: hypothetical protein WBX25_01310 [Rhodomicrobium sp.]